VRVTKTGTNHRAQQLIDDASALLESIRGVHERGQRRLVGVTGPPGAGKTHLATFLGRSIAEAVVGIVPMDGFHLANEVLELAGTRQHKGRPDTFDVAGFINLLDRLRRRETGTIYAPRFRREIEEPIAGSIAIDNEADLVIVEGNYLLLDEAPWDAIAPRLDATYYLDTPEAIRAERLLARHRQTYGNRAREWIDRVDRPNAVMVETTRPRADFLVRHFDLDGDALL
jgi:pantothenate kinase